MAAWFDWLRPKDPGPRTLEPPEPPPAPGHAPPDPLGLPDFLARLRIGDRTRLKAADHAAAGRRLGLPAAVIQAVVQVESGGNSGFNENGLPRITFEPHVFSRLTRGAHDASAPDVSYPAMDPRKYPQSQDVRWRQLGRAYTLDPEAALQAASWGAFQILGINFAACGFPTAAAFAAYLAGSEARQLDAFETFITHHDLLGLLKARKWTEFAKIYNGPRFAEPYGRQMARAYKAIARGGGVA